jgi:serine/threonine-protein kinase RsbW
MACTGDHNNEVTQTSPDTNGCWSFDEKIQSQPDNCAKIVETVLSKLEAYQWGNRDTFGIHMAMEEAVMNAIRHGNKCDTEKTVHVEIEICEARFYSRVTDQGEGFNPKDIPDPTLEENLDKTSGRGVMLMTSFVDKVTYNDVGNSVELEKKKSE